VGGLASGITPQTGLVSEPNPTALANTLAQALSETKTFTTSESFEVLKEEKSWHRFCKLFSNTIIKK
ncbi:MAG: hypothetical protein ACPF95_05055, partial [Flavobacteriaceae bacterium]